MIRNAPATKSDIDILKRGLESRIGKLESRILESEVKILGELKDMREETSTHQFSHMRINEDMIEQDNRLKRIETTIAI